MISEKEQIERRAAVQNALANQRIAGLEPDNQVLKDADKWVLGNLSITEAIAQYKERLKTGKS